MKKKPVNTPVVTKKPVSLTTPRTFTVNGSPVTLFKVVKLNNKGWWTGGRSPFEWTPYFPSSVGPGKPCVLRTTRRLSLCNYGLHVTNRPRQWGANTTPDQRTRIFEARVFGPTKGSLTTDNKICAYKVQLVREVCNPTLVDASEWAIVASR